MSDPVCLILDDSELESTTIKETRKWNDFTPTINPFDRTFMRTYPRFAKTFPVREMPSTPNLLEKVKNLLSTPRIMPEQVEKPQLK